MTKSMATNRFATMLHKNNHKLIVVLVYALFEWFLIILLLLNSMFGYLITKFANYFGLKRPCLWCSRIDQILEPCKVKSIYTDLVCDSHATEISKLGYCSIHRKLVESHKMCENCLASIPISNENCYTPNLFEDDERTCRCFCCNESFSNKTQLPYLLHKPSWGCLEDTQKGDFIIKSVDDNIEEEQDETRVRDVLQFCPDVHSFSFKDTTEEEYPSSTSMSLCYEKEAKEDNMSGSVDFSQHVCNGTDNAIHCLSEENNLSETSRDIVNISSMNNTRKQNQDCIGEETEEILIDSSGLEKMENTSIRESSDEKIQGVEQEQLCILSKPNESKDHVESLNYLQKTLVSLEKGKVGVKYSIDGSMVSEVDDGNAFTTIEQLKTTLDAERKALSGLYAELEEERSAAAIAANQTMAMITRLQEEKAAMQMEALQYQRMMEEQTEYDQEALQLMNDLMIKREKEKQEVEKQLEEYQKKVIYYEEKERMRMVRDESRNTSASCSQAWDIDSISIDLNRDVLDGDSSLFSLQENCNNAANLEEMALDCVNHISVLDDSLAEFEEERTTILDQLKALEEKLIKLSENEEASEDHKPTEHSSEDHKPTEHSSSCNVEDFEENHACLEINNETEEAIRCKEKVETHSVEMKNSSISNFDLCERNELEIGEEVEQVYERLQALEEENHFLRHSMSSIKNGDKGKDLLQEILLHLQDLRTIELSTQNKTDEPVSQDQVPVEY